MIAHRVDLQAVERRGRFDRDRLGLAVGGQLQLALRMAAEPRRGHAQRGLGAVEGDARADRHARRGHQPRLQARGEGEQRLRAVIDAAFREVRRALERHRLRGRLALDRARDQPRHRRAVAADVEDRAAAEVVAEEAALGQVGAGVPAEDRLQQPQLAEPAGAHQLHDRRGLRVAAVHEGLHEEDAVLPRGLGRLHRLRAVERERLFAKDVLARARRGNGPGRVLRVRRADVDGLHVGIGQQRFVAPVRAAGELAREGVGAVRCAAGHGGEPSGAGGGQALREGAGNAAGAQDAPGETGGVRSWPKGAAAAARGQETRLQFLWYVL